MKHCVFAALVLVLTALGAHAQVTTSRLMGLIKDAKGEPSIGATVRALHTPSGPTYGAATNADGRFVIQNMCIGVTYTVEISYVGARTTTRNNVVLQLASPTC